MARNEGSCRGRLPSPRKSNPSAIEAHVDLHAGARYSVDMGVARKLATYEDLEALEEGARAEVLGGEIVTAPAPLPRHSKAQRALARFIGGPFDDDHGRGGPGGWWILLEVDIRLTPHDIVRPDLAGWRRERLPAPWDVRPIDVPPDWACEVVSPSTHAFDRVHKRRLYAEADIATFWIVDPVERILEAYELREGRWTEAGSYGASDTARVPPFGAIELEVGRLFPEEESAAR
jgi:Uma2 family endonuclease